MWFSRFSRDNLNWYVVSLVSTIALCFSSLNINTEDLTLFTVYFPSSFEYLRKHTCVRDTTRFLIIIWLFWAYHLVAAPMKISEAGTFASIKKTIFGCDDFIVSLGVGNGQNIAGTSIPFSVRGSLIQLALHQVDILGIAIKRDD